MRMDLFGASRPPSSSGSSDAGSRNGPSVVAIECVTGSSKAEEWSEDTVQAGDIVEEIRLGEGGGGGSLAAPFKNGRSGLQKALRSSFKKGQTSVWVRVRRVSPGEDSEVSVELQACIVPQEGAGRRQYVLRSIRDPNYAVSFVDRIERDCLQLQGTRSSRVACALSNAQLRDGYGSYPWEKKMRDSLPIPGSSCFLSLLVLPKSSDPSNSRYNSMEDTLARANAWLNSAQANGVPIVFMNVQTEPMLTKISGETASSTVNAGSLADLSNIANSSLYGFEDYHGVDIGVVKAVRLWYTPVAGEFALEIKLLEGDSKLGFSVSRNDEGFIHISSVVDEDDVSDDVSLPSTRSGLRRLYKEATSASKLLVISRISNEKVLPWMVNASGAIRCFDTVSISQKLSLHRHALRPILLHVLMWDHEPFSPASRHGNGPRRPVEQIMRSVSLSDDAGLTRGSMGEASFRFIDFPV